MAQKAYGGVGGKARNGIALYCGVNGKARKVVKGYVGVNGKARQFWVNYIKIQYKIVFDNNYEAGNYYNLTKGDCLTALKYALREWLWLNQYRVHPDLAYYFDKYEQRVISDFLSQYNSEDEIQIKISGYYPSTGFEIRSVKINIYLVNSDRTNAYISNAGYNAFVSGGSEAGYYRAITDLIPFADYDKTIGISITAGGNYTFGLNADATTKNLIGTDLNLNETAPGSRYIDVYTSNLGAHFIEVVYPEDYWLEWDFSREGNDKYFDTQRGIYFGKATNGVFDDGYLKLTEGWWEPPFWVYNVLGYCSLKFEFDGEITIGDTSENRPIFKLNNNYGLFYRNTGYWGFHDGAWCMSSNDNPNIFYDGHVEFDLTFDNFLEVPRITFPNQSFEQSDPRITLGGAGSNQVAYWEIRRLRITLTPIDYSNIVYYRQKYYLSPEGVDVQYNTIKSDDYSTFVQYYGTNKCFHYQGVGYNNSSTWVIDTRTLYSIPSTNIRFTPISNDRANHRLYIPVNVLTGYTKLEAVIGRQGSVDASTHRVGFGVAYVDDNDVLQTEGLTDLEVVTNRYSRFFFDITFRKIDYIYCETTGGGTPHFKLLRIY